MASLGYETTQISGLLGLSRPTVYRMMRDADINQAARFSNISDSELDHRISGIEVLHPNIEDVMASGHLRAQEIRVKRSTLRSSLHRVDPEGVVER